MSTKTEKDKTKQLQDKCQSVLNSLLRDEDNKYCVDCDSKGPRWASWNIGVFLCIRCAGIHRNLGVHISKVKSVNLDTWTPEQVVSLQQMGNSRARAVYEANLPDNFRRPQSDSSLESFIRAKYEHKKYIAREWVPPTMPKVNWEKEIDEEIEKQKRKKKTIVEKKSLGAVEVPQLPKPTNPSPKLNRIVNSNVAEEKKEKKDSDLLGLQNGEDTFSNFVSAPKTQETQNQANNEAAAAKTEEESFFNQVLPTEREKVKLDKESILALYGNAPTNFNQFSQVPYPTGSAFSGNFGGFPQQQQQQQSVYPIQNGGTQMPGQWMQQQQQQQGQNQQWANPVQFTGQQVPFMGKPIAMAGGQFGRGQFQGFPQATPVSGQFYQQPLPVTAGFTQPNPFFGSQNLQQQFSNLNLSNPATNTSNLWQ